MLSDSKERRVRGVKGSAKRIPINTTAASLRAAAATCFALVAAVVVDGVG